MVKAPAAPAKKLRILALHGGYQNGPSFDTLRLKDFKRRLKDICEITCFRKNQILKNVQVFREMRRNARTSIIEKIFFCPKIIFNNYWTKKYM